MNGKRDFSAFKRGGFTVKIVDEFTTSKYYKEEIYPNIKDKSVLYRNTLIPTYVKEHLDDINVLEDIIISTYTDSTSAIKNLTTSTIVIKCI